MRLLSVLHVPLKCAQKSFLVFVLGGGCSLGPQRSKKRAWHCTVFQSAKPVQATELSSPSCIPQAQSRRYRSSSQTGASSTEFYPSSAEVGLLSKDVCQCVKSTWPPSTCCPQCQPWAFAFLSLVQFFVWGPHRLELRAESWLCAKDSLGNHMGARNRSRVGHSQGKRPPGCDINSGPNQWSVFWQIKPSN